MKVSLAGSSKSVTLKRLGRNQISAGRRTRTRAARLELSVFRTKGDTLKKLPRAIEADLNVVLRLGL